MIFCPPLGLHDDTYFLILFVISYVSPIINVYSIFCILFRSKKHMTTYKYLLLKHQILGFALDFTMSTLVKPVLILPFPGGFANGVLPINISVHYYAILLFWMTCMVQVSIMHLFDYRYLLATGQQVFPALHKIALTCAYIIYCWPGFSFILAREDEQAVQRRVMEDYSCFTNEIANIPGLILYDPDRIVKLLCIPQFLMIIFTAVMSNILILMTRKSLKRTTLSQKTAQLQKKFLFQLCCQVTVPMILVLLPGAGVVYIVGQQVFNMQVPGIMLLTSLSMYGALGGLLLIALNPPYYKYSCDGKRKIEVKVFSKVAPSTNEK